LWQYLFGVFGEHFAYAWCHYELKAHFTLRSSSF